MKSVYILVLGGLFASGCKMSDPGFDAMGHFEADEFSIMTATSGRLIRFDIQEGQKIAKGDTIAITDTTLLHLQKLQAEAQLNALKSKLPGIRAQERVVETEIEILKQEKDRFSRLVTDQAAGTKSIDDLNNQISLAQAKKETFQTQRLNLTQEQKVLEAQMALLSEQIELCNVGALQGGVVLDKIANEGDMMMPGKPLVRAANLDTLILKAYVSGDQLSAIQIGKTVEVKIDGPDDTLISYQGTVIQVADQAEFTPKVIQTKKERVNLVYAIKVMVPNDGRIKIGMPGEMVLKHE